MGTPHMHAAVIKAWADGATVEWRHPGGVWQPVDCPTWSNKCEYRVKPHRWQAEMDAHKAGKTVQVRFNQHGHWTNWIDCIPASQSDLEWGDGTDMRREYRVKPDVIRYRRWLANYGPNAGGYQVRAHRDGGLIDERMSSFVRWIDTEWQEVEVPT